MVAKIFVSSVVDASADTVWDAIRDFNGLPTWHPAVAESEIKDGLPSSQVGCVRVLTLGDGAKIVETLLELSDAKRSVTYDIVESPLGVNGYLATLGVKPVTDGDRSYVEWTAEFEPQEGHDGAERVEFIGTNVFQAGLTALAEKVGR
jgi:polyketide cyclase/dehydrase/lipid transport protein